MPRPPRAQFPGATYHVTSRGIRRQAIFRDEDDRSFFLKLLELVARRFDWSCLAYCLMTTHYHLVIETKDGNLAAGMQRLNGDFAQNFNRRHEETGHLFERRYHSVLVEDELHLLELYRYMALNPVRAGICTRPEAWRWSSYPAAIGAAPAPAFLAIEWALESFAHDRQRARHLLCAFVEDVDIASPLGNGV
jgi:putative transposase